MLGPRWREVDLKNKRVSIVIATVDANREATVSEPKTSRGRRTVTLDVVTAAELELHRIHQLESACGSAIPGWTRVSCSPTLMDLIYIRDS
ncbi:MAG TPA: hypothetical protein VMU99_04455 [Acidimicrobiales bacterium]|nr:hypothetical protein [Acidimicrobiales bacterium]